MRVKTYNFKEFMRKEHGNKAKIPAVPLIPLVTAPLWSTMKVGAEEAIQVKMITAFDPIINLIQAMAYPVAMVVVLGGALFIMVGNKDKGFSMMQTAGLGYVLVMVAPVILNVLVDAMKGVI